MQSSTKAAPCEQRARHAEPVPDTSSAKLKNRMAGDKEVEAVEIRIEDRRSFLVAITINHGCQPRL